MTQKGCAFHGEERVAILCSFVEGCPHPASWVVILAMAHSTSRRDIDFVGKSRVRFSIGCGFEAPLRPPAAARLGSSDPLGLC